MEYNESYQGHRIIVTTTKEELADRWRATAELPDDGPQIFSAGEAQHSYASEDEARRAALTIAAVSIDRSRASRGKV